MNDNITSTQHLSGDFMRSYLVGSLANAQEYLQVEEHLSDCADCAKKIKELSPKLTFSERSLLKAVASSGPIAEELVDFARGDTTLSAEARTLIESRDRYRQEAEELHSFIDSMTEDDWAEVDAIQFPAAETERVGIVAAVETPTEDKPYALYEPPSPELPKPSFFDWLRSTLLTARGFAYSGAAAALLIVSIVGIRMLNTNPKILGSASNGTTNDGGKNLPPIDNSRPKTPEEIKILVDNTVPKARTALAFLKGAKEANDGFSPSGSVIKDTAPLFQWQLDTAPQVGAVYVVKIFENNGVIHESGSLPLTESQWQINKDLNRGKVYSWQVFQDYNQTSLPVSSRMRFKVLSSSSLQNLEATEKRWKNNPFNLALLYLEYGLLEEMKEQVDTLSVEEKNALRAALDSALKEK